MLDPFKHSSQDVLGCQKLQVGRHHARPGLLVFLGIPWWFLGALAEARWTQSCDRARMHQQPEHVATLRQLQEAGVHSAHNGPTHDCALPLVSDQAYSKQRCHLLFLCSALVSQAEAMPASISSAVLGAPCYTGLTSSQWNCCLSLTWANIRNA